MSVLNTFVVSVVTALVIGGMVAHYVVVQFAILSQALSVVGHG